MSYGLAHNLGFLGECVAHTTRFCIRPPISRQSVLLLGARRQFSNQKLRNELGWKPAVPFEDGVQKTIAWFRASGS
jgi:nucleoside-diphosphate-sugar epimerase